MSKSRKKIKRVGWLRLFPAVLLCMILTFPSFAGETADLEMSLTYGYGNTAKSGQLLPVTVTFRNKTGEEIRGFLSVEVPGEKTEISYTQAVSVPVGEFFLRQTVTIPDSVNENAQDRLRARFFDDAGEEILTDEVTVSYLGSGQEVLCGVLSEEPEKLQYLGNIGIGNGLNTSLVSLDPEELPEEAEGMSQLDILVISGYETRKLGEDCVQAIMDWVSAGGILLFGTGKTQQPLGAFYAFLGKPELSAASLRDVDMGMQYSTTGPDGAVLKLFVRNLTWQGAAVLRQSDDWSLLCRKGFGKGSVSIAGWDFCDLSGFAGERPDFTEELLGEVIGQTGLSRISGNLLSGEERLSSGRELTNTYEESAVPEIRFYIILSGLFLLVTGTGLFKYLRGRGLGIYYPLGVLILGMGFALLFWFVSGNFRFSGPFLDYGVISFYGEEADGVEVLDRKAFISMESPLNSAMTLELPANCTVRPISTVGQISVTSGKTEMIAVAGQKKFEQNCFLVEQKTEVSREKLPVQGQFSFGKEGLTGTVTNTGTEKLQGLTVVARVQFQYLGDLEPGETVSVDINSWVYGPVSETGLVSSQTAGKWKNFSCELQKEKLMEYCLRESTSIEEGKILILGFSDTSLPDALTGSGYRKKGSVLVAAECTADQGQTPHYALASVTQTVSGSYDPVSGCIPGNTTTVLIYSLGSGDQITGLRLHSLSEALEEYGISAFSGQMAMYNYSSAAYEAVDEEKTEWSAEELKNYLSPANNLTVRFIPEEESHKEGLFWLPVFYTEGSRKTETAEPAAVGTGPVQKEVKAEPEKTPASSERTDKIQTPDTGLEGPALEAEEIHLRTPGEH